LKKETITRRLKEILPTNQISTNQTVRDQHAGDESYHTKYLPDIVVFPHHTEQVSQVMVLANEEKIPVTPFGLGSSLEGHVIPHKGGISIDFSEMNQIKQVRENDFLVCAQPGLTRSQLNEHIRRFGMFFPVDPGADATLGGMAATNASGTTTVKYGVMRDQIADLEVVLSNGTIIHTGNLAKKSASGLHLNGLFVGSEGILGCITELTLQVHGIPEYIVSSRANFPNIKDATEAVISIMQAGIPIARVELVDEVSIKQINRQNNTSFPITPTLFMEFHGNKLGLQQDVEFMKEIVEDHNCQEIVFESDHVKRRKLWEARHQLAYAYIHGHPGKKMMVTDVCVPISELGNAILFAREQLNETELSGGILGHVGDGNFHVLLMIDARDPHELKVANTYNEKLVMYALEKGGTCTGEHGVGVGKIKYQEQEHQEAYRLMQQLKHTLDPNNILNPGKLISI